MDLEQWLTAHGLEEHLEVFVENRIEVDLLEHLTENDLNKMGLPVGSVRRFLVAIQAPQSAQAIPPGSQPTPQSPVEQPANQPVSPQPAGPQAAEVISPAAAAPPHQAPPTSSPQAPRHQPKAKNSRKATAIMIAVGVHVAIILLATTLTIFAASKDEPEIIASIAPSSAAPQQEMKKKTVQKQTRHTPSAASAAAAPMAMLMKTNARARFSTPDVTRTSTGPLGMNEGDLGAGAFGVGSGLGEGAGSGAMFMGTPVKGNLAVIFDITQSMGAAIPLVIKEINRNFKSSQVLVVWGGGTQRKHEMKIVPYQSNSLIQQCTRANTAKQNKEHKAIEMNKTLLKLQRCDSLLPVDKQHEVAHIPGSSAYLQNLQSLSRGIECLVNQAKPPGTIFVFSDFGDGSDTKYMKETAELCKRKRVKVVFWCPMGPIQRGPQIYQEFAETVGGEVKTEVLD